MKYYILFVAGALCLASCCREKSYTCECVTIVGKNQFEIKAATHGEAEKKCAAYTDKPELDGPYCRLSK